MINKIFKRTLALGLIVNLVVSPAYAADGAAIFFGSALNNILPRPAATALPTGFNPVQGFLDELTVKSGDTVAEMTVHQTEDKAIGEWQTFDIGEKAWVHFDQQGHTDWQALNRIYDQNPSQIFGRLTADGGVYLINQNGILFGSTSSVNVHKLAASALNLTDENFRSGNMVFDGTINYDALNQPDWQAGQGFVVNQGTINVELTKDINGQQTAVRDGSVIMLAPYVENSGAINAPFGQIVMAAGNGVVMAADNSAEYRNESMVETIVAPGLSSNAVGGLLEAHNGRVSLYGGQVEQDGAIVAATSVYHRGRIELLATDSVRTGVESVTATPVSENSEKTGADFVHRPGEIYIGGFGSGTIPPATVELNGLILANSGDVQVFARERIFMGEGALIDVSGIWADQDPADQWHTIQLNSAQLKNDPLLKGDNSLLYRSEITVNEYDGSNIGDLGEAYQASMLTSLEKAVKGGSISLQAADGDILVSQNVVFDISGGGLKNADSVGIGTRLVFNDQVYSLADAPAYLPYEAFADYYQKDYARFGLSETYRGLYTGGANPLYDHIPSHIEGADAGSLKLISSNFVFDGSIIANLVIGPYQYYDASLFDENGLIEIDGKQFSDRYRRPQGGTLQLGGPASSSDVSISEKGNVLGEVIIAGKEEILATDQATLPEGFNPSQERSLALPSYLAAETINASGIDRLIINSNTLVITKPGTELRLPTGGEVAIAARRIEHYGEIVAPAGTVAMTIESNWTEVPSHESYQELEQRIYLADGSRIDTSGERQDNAAVVENGQSPVPGVQKAGGSVLLHDNTTDNFENIYDLPQGDGVIVATGAELDVGGGYEITEKGAMRAGNAGEIVISGSNVVLDGILKGYAVEGGNGGSIKIFANNINIVEPGPAPVGIGADDPLPVLDFGHDPASDPENQFGKGLIVAGDRFVDTGFSRIGLNSVFGLQVMPGVKIDVSTVKESASALLVPNHTDRQYLEKPEYLAGASSLALAAGKKLDQQTNLVYGNVYGGDYNIARLTMGEGSGIKVLPGGSVSLKGKDVYLAGEVNAPGGQITVQADSGNLLIAGTAKLLAPGYVSPLAIDAKAGLPMVEKVMDGGTISLRNESANGNLEIAAGAELNVDGTREVLIGYLNNQGSYQGVSGAGRAGSITLVTSGELTQNGSLSARANFPGVVNGSLRVEINNPTEGFALSTPGLLAIFRDNDFYQWEFASSRQIVFDENLELAHAGKIVFDTPLLLDRNGAQVTIAADWLRLQNTYFPTARVLETGTGSIQLTGGYLEVAGSVGVSGAESIGLNSRKDLSFADYFYQSSGNSGSSFYQGDFITAGDLTLQADRIFPTAFSEVNIQAADRLTILPGNPAADGIIYSAAGRLTLQANRIDHQGYLAAPLGTINLIGTGSQSRIMLSPGSVTSVAGLDGIVEFGALNDTGEFWTYLPKEYAGTEKYANVEGAPEKNLVLEGDEVIVREGAKVDLSGGGAIFAYRYLSGLEGTVNPLVKTGQYVLVPKLELPGTVVHLAGNSLVAAGTYSVLPLDSGNADNAKYAFLPGALIISDQGALSGALPGTTSEGYAMVQGSLGVRGLATDPGMPRGFSVRTADEVMKDGFFQTKKFVGGDGGSFELVGKQSTVTSILEGAVDAHALEGFRGGTFTAAAKLVEIGAEASGLPADFTIDYELPLDLQGKLNIKDTTLTGNGFSKVVVGDTDITRSIIVKEGSQVISENVYLNVGSGDLNGVTVAGTITVEVGAEIHAVQPDAGGSGNSEIVFTADAHNLDATTITLKDGSLAHAADHLTFDTDNLVLEGADRLHIDHGGLTLKSRRIVFGDAGALPADNLGGLFLDSAQWDQFATIEEISLDSATDILFAGDFNLTSPARLLFDAQRIGGYQEGGGAEVSVSAPWITLINSKPTYVESENRPWLASVVDLGAPAGSVLVGRADNGITLGSGDLLLQGFADVRLATGGDIALTGQAFQGKDLREAAIYSSSALRTAGNLDLSAARLILDPLQDGNYKATDYLLAVGEVLNISSGPGATTGGAVARGGRLRIEADTINQNGIIDTVSGTIDMNGVNVNIDGSIRAVGSDFSPAGSITITAAERLTIGTIGSLDVSAGSQGDAGSLVLLAPAADLVLAGRLLASAPEGGRGGSLQLDAKNLSGLGGGLNFDTLNTLLAAGGFTDTIDVRSRTGNLTIGADQTVTARTIKLAADDQANGNIEVYGVIESSGADGGSVELDGYNNVTLHDSSRIRASALSTQGDGGQVYLSSRQGFVNLNSGAGIDVSAGSAASADKSGTVKFRAKRNATNNGANLDLRGTITGAGQVEAEAFKAYTFTSIGATQLTQMKNEATSYLNAPATIFNNLQLADPATTRLENRAGVEVVSSTNLSLDTAWTLANWLGTGYTPANVTLRAAGNLDIKNNLIDKRTTSGTPVSLNYLDPVNKPSADLTLVAGADLTAADLLAVNRNLAQSTTGKLTISDNKKVYTESGDIRFASAADTTIGLAPGAQLANDPTPWLEAKLSSTLSSYRGNILGRVGGSLTTKGVVQTASGDIDIAVGNNLYLYNPIGASQALIGAIRTTGLPQPLTAVQGKEDVRRFFDYAQGGDIRISSANDILGGETSIGVNWDKWWATENRWSAAYPSGSGDPATLGIATMGGGDLNVAARGDINLQIGAFGRGDLRVTGGSDLNGRYLVSDGVADIYAQGSFGTLNDAQHLELMKGSINLTVEGNLTLGTILNPSYVLGEKNKSASRLMGYTSESTVNLAALVGDVSISGKAFPMESSTALNDIRNALTALPPSLDIQSGRDLVFTTKAGTNLQLAPSPTGNLALTAGRDIYGTTLDSNGNPITTRIKMRQDDPAGYYGLQSGGLQDLMPLEPLHQDDTAPVLVQAGGEIRNLRLELPKKSEIVVAGDILDLELQVQNINSSDISKVTAGGDIVMGSYERTDNSGTGFRFAGPGAAVVMAAGNINLGTTAGIRTIANGMEGVTGSIWATGVHPYLSSEGADLYVLAGFADATTPARIDGFFDSLRGQGVEFSQLMAMGKVTEARALEATARAELIAALLGDANPQVIPGVGNISMTQSSIATAYGGNVNILARGRMDVGGTSFSQRNSSSGIRTEAGGGINIYGVGDVNVNESRVMTWMGGDVTVWCDGDINAGRGSKTAVNASGAAVARVNESGVFELQKKPAVGGSGVRAVTYDPDGPSGQRQQPEPGNIYLFAPNGTIDAGEAGIAGNQIFLAANKVLNAQNITFSQSSIGVPVATDVSVNLGAISGAGTMAAATNEVSRTSSGLDSVREQEPVLATQDLAETLVAKLLKVEVIDLLDDFTNRNKE
jgi:filamentous hemagglutinin family protein